MSKKLEDYPDLLTVQDVCEVLRVGRRTVYQYIQEQKILGRKIAGKYRIPKAVVKKFISEIGERTCYTDVSVDSDALLQKKECTE